MIILSWTDLALATLLVIFIAIFAAYIGMKSFSYKFLFAATRTFIQLLLIGWVLKWLFIQTNIIWVILLSSIMLLVASYEISQRQKRKFKGWWSFSVGASSLFISSFTMTMFTLLIIIQADPWYHPQYAIPLLGMLLGNTMNAIALSLDRLTESAWQQRKIIEARLMLGQTWVETIKDIRLDSIRTGMITILNAMAAAGIVSIPGMMTGQILAGSSPVEAVKYQILIIFLIAVGSGIGSILSVYLSASHLFDDRERLCLDRLK
jgi:putative ABC transport system permease protein